MFGWPAVVTSMLTAEPPFSDSLPKVAVEFAAEFCAELLAMARAESRATADNLSTGRTRRQMVRATGKRGGNRSLSS